MKSLEQNLVNCLTLERENNGPYISLYDFYRRVKPGIEQLSILIKARAFQSFGKDKKELFWEGYYYIQNIRHEDPGLFEITLPRFKLLHFRLKTDSTNWNCWALRSHRHLKWWQKKWAAPFRPIIFRCFKNQK